MSQGEREEFFLELALLSVTLPLGSDLEFAPDLVLGPFRQGRESSSGFLAVR